MTVVALPFTYADLVLTDDMSPLATETTSDMQSLVQDLMHVLEELPGSNLDDPTRGIGIDSLLGGTTQDFVAAAATIDVQYEKDARVQSSTTTVSSVTNGNGEVAYFIASVIQPTSSVLPINANFLYSPASGVQVAA